MVTLLSENGPSVAQDVTKIAGAFAARGGWYLQRLADQTTVCRQIPARFDVHAETVLPDANPTRLAHQIRQDVWRALRHVRGFSPVVQITTADDGLQIKAGGRVLGPIAPKLSQTISDVLENPKSRARWMRCAKVRADK